MPNSVSMTDATSDGPGTENGPKCYFVSLLDSPNALSAMWPILVKGINALFNILVEAKEKEQQLTSTILGATP